MEWFICIALLLVGLILIIKGGDWFVDAASWIAKVSGIPSFVIGATIVSVATTLPEILVSAIGAAEGDIGLAVGNAVGSVNANIGLILGISLLFLPGVFKRKSYIGKTSILLVTIALLFAFCAIGGTDNGGTLELWQSIVIIVFFAVFIVENLYSMKKQQTAQEGTLNAPLDANGNSMVMDSATISLQDGKRFAFSERNTVEIDTATGKKVKVKPTPREIAKNLFLFVLGAACITGGALHLNTYGQQLALMLGVPSDIIGVTIVAVGTSLPELTTAVIAIIKKKSDMSVGNIIGANIIDISLIMPLCAFIGGGTLPVNPQTFVLDLPFCLAVAAMAFLPALIRGKFMRWQGALLIAGYVTYITLLVLNVSSVGVINIFPS